MKNKLFFIFAVAVLITTPVLAGKVAVTSESGFGTLIATDTSTIGGDFNMTVTARVYHNAGIYTYVYEFTHDANDGLTMLEIFTALFDPTKSFGYVGTVDPFITPDAAGLDYNVGSLGTTTAFHFNGLAPNSDYIVYAQSTYAQDFFDFGFRGTDGLATIQTLLGSTLAPSLTGGGAAVVTPEPATLLLLTTGLLGGALRFRRRSSDRGAGGANDRL